VLHAGAVRARHFHHEPALGCDPDRVTHRTAILRVVQAVRDWKAGLGPRPEVHRTCTTANCGATGWQPIPDKVDGAVDEFGLPGLGRCPDITLLAAGQAAAFIEVFKAHKADDLPALKWIEVDADRVIDDPVRWHPNPRPLPAVDVR
jgi:hypothetical protein